jgi:hypothetical protein
MCSKALIFALLAVAPMACTTDRGGSVDTTEYEAGAASAGAPSPTMRPGMNREDPRDPHYTTRPQPDVSPPTSK